MKDDLISRQDAIKVVEGIDSYFVKYIEQLPSAQPEVTADMVDSYVKPRHLRVISEEFYLHLTAGKYLPPPPIFQPEIIRCRDCLMHGVCRFEQGLGLDGYCSQAERRQKNG